MRSELDPAVRPQPRGTSIRIFLADGTPEGLRLASLSNWTGSALVVSRAQYPDVRDRPEFRRPAVYVLIGADEGSATSRVYIGEADDARERLGDHVRRKDFWTSLILFTSSDESLNKAHVRYLESRLISLAMAAKRVDVENANATALPPLSEADREDTESFLANMLVLFPVLGLDAFERAAEERAHQSDRTRLYLNERGAKAEGIDAPEGFIVFEGARARADEVPSITEKIRGDRSELKERGLLVPDGDTLVLTEDYRFTSPSAASAVLVGGSSNGRLAWVTRDGQSLKDLQAAAAD